LTYFASAAVSASERTSGSQLAGVSSIFVGSVCSEICTSLSSRASYFHPQDKIINQNRDTSSIAASNPFGIPKNRKLGMDIPISARQHKDAPPFGSQKENANHS